MIDTNAVLAVTFALISQFHAVVKVPPEQIPTTREDISKLVVGSPLCPVDIFLLSRNGTSYLIQEGAIIRSQTTNSFSQLQDPSLIAAFAVPPKVSSNEVFTLGVKAVEGLVTPGKRFTDGPPKLTTGRTTMRGKPIAVYGMTWPSSSREYDSGAQVEIDGRTGEITCLWLIAPCFKDHTRAQEISNRVFRAESGPAPKPPPKRPRLSPFPPTNEVAQAISAMVKVCEKLGMNPGTHTNLADVDWDMTCTFTNQGLSVVKPVLQVHFTSGAKLHCLDGAVVSCALEDKYFTAEHLSKRPERMERFHGKVTRRWEDLAAEFEKFHFASAAQPKLTVPSARQRSYPTGLFASSGPIHFWASGAGGGS